MGSFISSNSSATSNNQTIAGMTTNSGNNSLVTTATEFSSVAGDMNGDKSLQSSSSTNYNYDLGDSTLSNSTNDLSNSTTVISNTTTLNNNGPESDNDNFRLNVFGTYIYPFRWYSLPTIYSWLGPLSSLAMIFGCVLPYVPQYITIHKNRNSSGFSTFVCLTLLIANILRVVWWFGHPFELPLLIQSGLMIVAQILLLALCVRVKKENHRILNETQGTIFEKRTLFSLNPRFFWRWTDLISYIEFLILFSVILGIAMYYLSHDKLFVESIGYCALVTESMLGLPQVLKNYKKRSVEGMSLSMVLMWLGGDTFKTVYYIVKNVPLQFWLCGLLQITIDLLILFQVCLFRQNAPLKAKNSLSSSGKSHHANSEDDSVSLPKEMMAL